MFGSRIRHTASGQTHKSEMLQVSLRSLSSIWLVLPKSCHPEWSKVSIEGAVGNSQIQWVESGYHFRATKRRTMASDSQRGSPPRSALPPPPRGITVLKRRTRSELWVRPRRVELIRLQPNPASQHFVIVSAPRTPIAYLGPRAPIKTSASLAAMNVEAVVTVGVKVLEMDQCSCMWAVTAGA